VPDTVRIGILGDFTPEFRSHHATNDALQHAAAKLNLTVQSEWLPTPSLVEPAAKKTLESFDGLWASPGSPYKSMEGMLKGIEFARTRDWPFLGTCGGFQYAVIECARKADLARNIPCVQIFRAHLPSILVAATHHNISTPTERN